MGQELVGRGFSGGAKVIDGLADIERVPIDDRRRDEVEARCLERLVVEGTVTHPALLMREHGLSKRMPRFAFVESRLALLAELFGFEPVEGEQGAFDPSDFLERKVEAVLPPVRAKLLEQHGREDCSCFYGGGEPDDFAPTFADDLEIEGPPDQGCQNCTHVGAREGPKFAVRQIAQASWTCNGFAPVTYLIMLPWPRMRAD
jgi:hypothetical protein